MAIAVLAFAALLAFANGANDNSKGVATLVGHGGARPRAALLWAAATTGLGALTGALLGGGLIAAFRAGFISTNAPLSTAFFVAVLAGACAWVLIATRTGLPVSTTHAILGGIVGAGLLEVGAAGIGWSALAVKAAVPLLLSPLLAMALVFLLGRPLAVLARRSERRCVCAVESLEPRMQGGAALAARRLALVTGDVASCEAHSPVAAVSGRGAAGAIHWATSGLIGFARGWNDTPKIVALALVALPASSGSHAAFAVVALAMALGGLLSGRRVLATLAQKITPLPLGESLAASGVSSLLVALASWRGLPVSTTHVTTGGILGAGMARSARDVRWHVVRDVALAWVVTIPAAALVAAATRFLLVP